MYTISSMFCSTPFIARFGEKMTLVYGLGVYCLYVMSYLIGKAIPSIEWYIVITGSIMGGAAAGCLWTAQGGYFSNCAKKYAMSKGVERTEATSFMSALFATFYLGFEVLVRILSSLLQIYACKAEWQGNIITGVCNNDDLEEKSHILIYTVYTLVAIVSAVGMCFVRNIEDPNELKEYASQEVFFIEERDSVSVGYYDKITMTLALLFKNRKMQLMVLVNVSFGFSSAYLNSYVVNTVITDNFGESKVGIFTSIIPLVATLSSFPISWINSYLGSKRCTMVLGSVCFTSFALAFLCFRAILLKRWPWTALILLFSMFGFGRAVWEGTNKAVFADFFPENPQAAFANIYLQSGAATTIAFFLFPSLYSFVKELTCVITGVGAIVCYFIADTMNTMDRRASQTIL